MLDNNEFDKDLPYDSQEVLDKWETVKKKPNLLDEILTWTHRNEKWKQIWKFWDQFLTFCIKFLFLVLMFYHLIQYGWIKILIEKIIDKDSLLDSLINIARNADTAKLSVVCLTVVIVLYIKQKYKNKDGDDEQKK